MILDVVGKVLSTAGKFIGGSVGENAAKIMGEIQTANNPELKKELEAIELNTKRLMVEDAKSAQELIREAAKSEDRVVRWARPALLWIGHAVIVFNFIVIPIIKLIQGGISPIDIITTGAQVQTLSYSFSLPEQFYWLYGSGFLGYGALRSLDKKGKNPLELLGIGK